LDAIDDGLHDEVLKKIPQYRAKGYSTAQATERALAAALANNMAEELIALGKGKPSTLMGLACAMGSSGVATPYSATGAYEELGFSIGGAISSVGSGIKSAAGGTVDFVKSGVKKIGSLACKVANSQAGTIAAGAAGSAIGGPGGAQAGVTGAQVAANACGGGSSAQSYQEAPMAPVASQEKSLLVPVAVAGAAALALVVLLK
jgi:hypothetical protein